MANKYTMEQQVLIVQQKERNINNLKESATDLENYISYLSEHIDEIQAEVNRLKSIQDDAEKRRKAIEQSIYLIEGTDDGKNSA